MSFRQSNGKLRLRNGLLALAVAGTLGAGGGTTPPSTGPDNGSGTATLSESSLLDYRILQRVGTSKTFSITATVTGADDTIEARTVNEATGAVVADWATVGTSSGGTVTGNVTAPQGGWYKLQLRKVSNTGAATTSTKRFGVGCLLALIGQSNMVHLSESALNYPLADLRTRRFKMPAAWAYTGNVDTTGASPPGAPFGAGGYSTYTGGSPNGDGLVYFVNALAAATGIPIGTLEYAVSGTNIESWQPGGSGANWNTFSAALAAAGNDCEMVLWYLGEDNAAASTTSAAYQAYLLNVLNGIKAQTGRTAATLGFGVVTLGPCNTYGPEGSFGTIRGAQLAFVAANAGTFLAGVAGDMTSSANDPVHINAQSEIRMGRRYAKSVLAYLAGAPKPGPKIAGATRSSNVITVGITGGAGAIKDGAGGSGAALKGFRVFDNGTAATISSTIISGSAVMLTLAATPAGTVTLDYGMANAPYGSLSPALTDVLYDSDTVPGDTLGLPLQPCGAIPVTGS